MTNFVEIGQARDKILSLKLDHASDVNSGTEGPKLFDSPVKSNPKHGQRWIAAAGSEEHAGRMVVARSSSGPKSEDAWLEPARLYVRGLFLSTTGFHLFLNQTPDGVKVIIVNTVQHMGQSVKIWFAAADLEHGVESQKACTAKA